MRSEWKNFNSGKWTEDIDVRNFIQKNYTPYTGDEGFLSSPTEKTKEVWKKSEKLIMEENKKMEFLM